MCFYGRFVCLYGCSKDQQSHRAGEGTAPVEDETELCCFGNRGNLRAMRSGKIQERWEKTKTKQKPRKLATSAMLTPSHHRVSLNLLFLQLVTRDGGECVVREAQVNVERQSRSLSRFMVHCCSIQDDGQMCGFFAEACNTGLLFMLPSIWRTGYEKAQ